MIIESLKNAMIKPQNNLLLVTTLLKNVLQDYVLRFIYEDKEYKNLVFTGGTALKKIYGLPRFSEDLDFDCQRMIDAEVFSRNIEKYFSEKLEYKEMTTKVSGNKKSVFLKFPVMKEIGLAKNNADKQVLFLRCDFAEQYQPNAVETVSLSVLDYVFFVRTYNLETLFTNKVEAFLKRMYFKGKDQEIPFKGRDIFDIAWFCELSAKNGFSLKPNYERLYEKLGESSPQGIFKDIVNKMEKINKNEVEKDLSLFLENQYAAKMFSENFLDTVKSKGKYVFV